ISGAGDRPPQRSHVAPKHLRALLGRELPQRLILDYKITIIPAVAQNPNSAREIEVALIQRAAVLAVLVADLPLLFAQVRWVADALHVRVHGPRRVLLVNLVNAGQRMPEPVPVSDVER